MGGLLELAGEVLAVGDGLLELLGLFEALLFPFLEEVVHFLCLHFKLLNILIQLNINMVQVHVISSSHHIITGAVTLRVR